MNILYYIAPLILVVFSNTMYHLISKNTPATVNPFAALVATYGSALVGSIILLLITKKTSIYEEMSNLKIANYIMGLIIIGVEGGYMLMYKNGWEISKGSLIANIFIAIILIFMGAVFFQEELHFTKMIGIAVCLIGIALVNVG